MGESNYRLHNPQCREIMQGSVDGMMQGYALVSASIRERTDKLCGIMDDYRKHGFQMQAIQKWEGKSKGAKYVYENRYELYNESMKLIKSKKKNAKADFVLRWVQVPGLGPVKASFVAQLMAGWVGCIDVHNIRKYMPDEDPKKGTPSRWQCAGLSLETQRKKVVDYIEFCERVGGPKVLWDQWCNARPLEMPKLIDGEHLSGLHPQWLTT